MFEFFYTKRDKKQTKNDSTHKQIVFFVGNVVTCPWPYDTIDESCILDTIVMILNATVIKW